MDVGDMLRLMRDPLGAPFFPQVFQVLLIITWVLHIFFVTLALGTSSFSIYGLVRGGEYTQRLARIAARLTPNSVGLGIVTGIAPLLFVQTIYDPIWYASNTLTGFWSVIFVFVVMGGYSMAYLFYLKGSEDRRLLGAAIASCVLIFFAGWIMHVLAAVSIRPDQWQAWYAPNGVIDTRGITFHAFNIPRLIFLLPLQAGLSLAIVLMLFGWYSRQRSDADLPFLRWVAERGRQIGLATSPLYAIFGLWWAATEGQEFGLTIPIGLILGLLGIGLFGYFWHMHDPLTQAPQALGLWSVVLLVVASTREAIRSISLERFGYRVSEYPFVIDWGSVLIFGVTSVVGVSVIAYLILVLYQSGLRQDGEPVSVGVDRLGRLSIGMLGAWFGFFLLVGFYATFVLK
ncbi:MAG: hypothetical protein OHK0050_38420 [Roseiflexaceae bacterium]